MLELRLLGALEISATDGRNVDSLVRQSKRTALLAYLAAALPRGFHRRDKLVALFWPESDDAHARAALSQALYVLRNALGEQAVLTRGDEEIGLSTEVVWCDVAAFEAALDGGRLVEALALYRGALLDGFFVTGAPEFERWLEAERARLRQRASGGAWALAETKAAAGDAVEAERWARRASDLLADDEAIVRRLMTFLHRLGDKAAAIRAYEAFAWRLAREDDLEPSAETQALAAAIRREDSPSLTPRPAEAAATALSPTFPAGRRVPAGWLAGLAGAALATLGALGLLVAGSSGDSERPAIAVLPFQNLSADGPHAYFAGGLHDEILTQLSKVSGLKVISRTSVMGYAGPSTPPLRQIGDELGVGNILEASVQVVGERLRVNVQLIDAGTGAHMWAERYERTLDDAFAIQSDIAQQVVVAVGAALSPTEQRRLAAAPTTNAEAYVFYLQGQAYENRPGGLRENYEIAEQLYERALALDPEFALAHAALSLVHGLMHFYRYDPSPGRAAREREEATTALRLAPNLPQAHLAMGSVYYSGRDWLRALAEYQEALSGLPNDAELLSEIGAVYRRLGRWDEVLTVFERVLDLDPRKVDALWDLGAQTYRSLHRYDEEVRLLDRALTLVPDLHVARIERGWAFVRGWGKLDTLRRVLRDLSGDVITAYGPAESHRVELAMLERDWDTVLDLIGDPRAFVDRGSDYLFAPGFLYVARVHQLKGRDDAARAAFLTARQLLDSAVRELPEDWRVHGALGLAEAGLGHRVEARRQAHWLATSDTYRRDAFDGPLLAEARAKILAHVGDMDAALDEIERLLAGPSWTSVHTLRLDPRWDPIRDHPRFRALLAKHRN